MYNTEEKIINFIKNNKEVTPNEIVQNISLGRAMAHRHLKRLVEQGFIIKLGSAPKVYYKIKNQSNGSNLKSLDIQLDSKTKQIIEDNFTYITPDGGEFAGTDGFILWCTNPKRKYDIQKTATTYAKSINEYNAFKKNGFIDATVKVQNTFTHNDLFLDKLYFLHPYNLPIFGKTKIATWLFHGKQTENKLLMQRVFDIILPEIQEFIKKNKPNAIAFVPPTVPRNIQFMKELAKKIKTNLPILKIEKIRTPILIQQKSLKDIESRTENAMSTMVVKKAGQYNKVLVIDDFTGSGSTLNAISKKIKNQKIAKQVIGLTVTGSMNGFEVVKEI